MASSWSEEVCPHCKGYPEYTECTCSPEALARREERMIKRTTPWDGDEEVECIEVGYFCGSNYCDDPACTQEHAEIL